MTPACVKAKTKQSNKTKPRDPSLTRRTSGHLPKAVWPGEGQSQSLTWGFEIKMRSQWLFGVQTHRRQHSLSSATTVILCLQSSPSPQFCKRSWIVSLLLCFSCLEPTPRKQCKLELVVRHSCPNHLCGKIQGFEGIWTSPKDLYSKGMQTDLLSQGSVFPSIQTHGILQSLLNR